MMPELREYLPYGVLLVLILRDLVVELGLLRVLREALQRAQDHLPTAPVVVSAPPSVTAPSQNPPALPAPKPPVPTPAPTEAVDQGLLDYIKKTEGFSAKAYWDAKQWSIGYGTKANSPTEVISQTEAENRMKVEVLAADKLVTAKFPNLPLGVHQALTDLTYNAGPGWEEATLGQRVAEQKWDSVKADILLYNHSEGQVNAGLTARREAEVQWFDNPL